jgi:hypothetical protein
LNGQECELGGALPPWAAFGQVFVCQFYQVGTFSNALKERKSSMFVTEINKMWLKITWDWNLVAYLKKVLWSSGISVARQ